MPLRLPAHVVACCSLAALATHTTSCGLGTVGIAAAADEGDDVSDSAPTVSIELLASTEVSPASVSFELKDAQSDDATISVVSFRALGSPPSTQSVTIAAEYLYSDELLTVPVSFGPLAAKSDGSSDYTFYWDFSSQLADDPSHFPGTSETAFHGPLELSIVLVGGGADVQEFPGIGNDPPEVLEVMPPACGSCELSGTIAMAFRVRDSSAHDVDVSADFDFVSDSLGWRPASALVPLQSIPTTSAAQGLQYVFVWQSDAPADLAEREGLVHFRITATDGFPGKGALATTVAFPVDNNAAPIAFFDEGQFLLNPDRRRGIPVTFQILDLEQDDVHVLIQWRRSGEPFPGLGTDAADLLDLLGNPAREEERREKHVATEAPIAFTGMVGGLAGLRPEEVRLPELASSAAGALGHGVDGRTLEILRSSNVPVPATGWTEQELDMPVAALPCDGGTSALVLDRSDTGWRLREIDLVTGAPLTTFAVGAGSPRALSFDPRREKVFIGTSLALHVFDLELRTEIGTVPHDFADGPRAIAPLGSRVIVATGDDVIARFDFDSGNRVDLISGLDGPFGLAVDPLEPGRVYVSERGRDRVLSVEIDPPALLNVPAELPPDSVGPGLVAFPSPGAIALELGGSRLLVLSTADGRLRALNLRSPNDLDVPANGSADPYVYPIGGFLPSSGGGLSVGADGLRIVCLEATNSLAIGGGVRERRAIVDASSIPGQAAPYDPTRQVVRLTSAPSIAPGPGQPWRIRAPLRPRSSTSGVSNTFVWQTADVIGGGPVQIRILPIDTDIGTPSLGAGFKTVLCPSAGSSIGLPSDPGPQDVAAADLDGDGDVDLVSAHASSGHLTIRFQTAPGVFSQPGTSLAAGRSPRFVAASDLDADGDLDLVSANSDSDDLTIFLQDPVGTFSTEAFLATGSSPQSVAVSDLDGNGLVDIVSGNSGSNDLSIFLQIGSQGFPAVGMTLNAGSSPSSIAATDLNGDGAMDFVVANTGSDSLTVFTQTSQGSLNWTTLELPTGDAPRSLAAADLDGDGTVDLVSANQGSDDLTILRQVSPGVFVREVRPLPTGDAPRFVRAVDLEGDGDVDLATANQGSDDVTLYYQEAPGEFTRAGSLMATGDFPQSVAAADLDGDGDIDLVSANLGTNDLTQFFQTAAGVFAPLSTGLPTGDSPLSLGVGDLDTDGDVDLVTASLSGDALTLYFQTAPGVLTPSATTLATGDSPLSIAVADLDANGSLDIVSANVISSDLTLYFQGEPGVFTEASVALPTGFNPLFVAAGDLDGNGSVDLASANGGSDDLTIYFQSAPGVFEQPGVALAVGGTPQSVLIVDLDHDGAADLVTANGASNDLRLFYQVTDGVFGQPAVVLPTGDGPLSVAAADLDGDGDVDLATANSISDDLTLYLQSGPRRFTPAAGTLPTGSSPRSISAADLDGDGDVDLVVANSSGDSLTVYSQILPGTFAASAGMHPTGDSPRPVVAADLDVDGDVDLVTTNGLSDDLTVFFNGH